MTTAYEERDKTCESLQAKVAELEERLAVLLKVPAPGDKKKAKDVPLG